MSWGAPCGREPGSRENGLDVDSWKWRCARHARHAPALALLEMVLQAHFVVIDALVRALDAGIGEMLVAIAELILAFIAEAHAGADVIAELESGAELALLIERSRGQQMHAHAELQVRRDGRTGRLLKPQHRREADVEDAAMRLCDAVVVPIAEIRLPVAAEMPVAHFDPFLVPVPLDTNATHVHAHVRRIGVPIDDRHAVDCVHSGAYHQSGRGYQVS